MMKNEILSNEKNDQMMKMMKMIWFLSNNFILSNDLSFIYIYIKNYFITGRANPISCAVGLR